MATKRGAHERPAGQQGSYQQSGYPQGNYQQGANQQPSASQEAYERAYRSYVNQQRASGAGQAGQYAQPGNRGGAYQQQAYHQQGYRQQGSYSQYGAGGGAYVQQSPNGWQPVQKKKGHPIRNTVLVLLLLLVIIGGVGGFTGYTLYNSAKVVKADAAAVMTDISDLKSQIMSDDPSKANATAADIAKRAKDMKAETDGWAWKVASYVPVYGGDVAKVKELSNVFDDLATNALIPFIGDVSEASMKNLFHDGAINVDYTQKLMNSLSTAAPVIERSAKALDSMGDAKLEQVNAPLKKARHALDKLDEISKFAADFAPTMSHVLGADGSARTYLIIAQSPAEIHSTGGFYGSIGPLYMDNGSIDLGDFRTIVDIYPKTGDYAPLTDEELDIFGEHVSKVPGNTGWIPDFKRAGEIEAFYWAQAGHGGVDGVIVVDPVFLQHMVGLVGSVTLSNGVELTGENTARYLLHDVYFLPTAEQDPIFEETAKLAFAQFMGNLQNVNLMKFAQQINADMKNKRVQVYMANEAEEAAMAQLGCTGSLDGTTGTPTIGVYVNDLAFSKFSWYIKYESSVGDGVKNADGTTTYPVSVRLTNMMSEEDLSTLPKLLQAANYDLKRSDFDMIEWVLTSAPAGASIANTAETEGYFSTGLFQKSYEGHDLRICTLQMEPGDSAAYTFDVVMPAGSDEKPVVQFCPNAQEVAGW